MIRLEPHEGGVVLPVRARPGARRTEVGGAHDGALKVAVTQVAEKGKANQVIIALLAKTFGVAKSRVELISGGSSSSKRFLLHGLDLAEARSTLTSLLD